MNNPFNRTRLTTRYILMVISAKGGVGKSTVTVNLAAALAARGLKVGIFDADVHGPNVPALLGIKQKANLSSQSTDAMMPIEAHPGSMDFRPITPVTRYGLQIMSLGLLVGEQQILNPKPEILGQMMAFLLARIDWGGIDVLLLDMPPGTGEPLNSNIESKLVDGALLVALRERLAHLDNGRLVTLLRAAHVPILGVVENMTHVICPRCGEAVELYPAPASAEPIYDSAPVLAALPFHPDLIRQIRPGPPLPLAESASLVAQSLLGLADIIRNETDNFNVKRNGKFSGGTTPNAI